MQPRMRYKIQLLMLPLENGTGAAVCILFENGMPMIRA